MAPVTSDLLETTRDKIKMDIAAKALKKQVSNNNDDKKQIKAEEKLKIKLEGEPTQPATKNSTTKKSSEDDLQENASMTTEDLLQKSNKIPLRLVNAHITCNICKGYLIDATTLVECLHTCKCLHLIIIFVVVVLYLYQFYVQIQILSFSLGLVFLCTFV